MNRIAILFTVLCTLACGMVMSEDAAPAPTPPNPGGANGGGGGGGGRQRFDPEQMRKRMLDRIKEQFGSTDDEWKAVEPKIEAVQKAQAASRTMGGFGGGRQRGGNGGGGGGGGAQPADEANPAPQSDLEKKTAELKALTDNKDADSKAVKDKLAEFRALRDKSKTDLKKAQDELRELLTPRQEALLVLMGMLD